MGIGKPNEPKRDPLLPFDAALRVAGDLRLVGEKIRKV